MVSYISYGLYSSLLIFRGSSKLRIPSESSVFTLKNIFDVIKITKRFGTREPMLILKNAYLYAQQILQNDEILYSGLEGYLKKIKGKKIKVKFKEVKILKEEDIKISNDFLIIYIDRSLLPEFVYIMHNLHARILKNILTLLVSKEIKIEDIKLDKDSLNELVLGVKVGLEPLFALALFYNSKYTKDTEFYINYIKFVNDLAVNVNKIVDILENREVENNVLLEIAEDIRKIRNEGLL